MYAVAARVAKQEIKMPSRNWWGSFSIRWRLLNVAGSLSSALTHMSVSVRSFGRNVHFSPVGKPCPAPPAQFGLLDEVDDRVRVHLGQRLAGGGVPTARLVNLQRVAVGHVEVAGQDRFERGHLGLSRFVRFARRHG